VKKVPALAGYEGGLYTEATGTETALAKVKEATLSISADTIDTTNFDTDGWAENIPSFRSWSVDATLLYVPDDTTQEDLEDALFGNLPLTVVLYPKDESSAKGYKGTAYITSYEVGAPVDDAVTISVTLTGSGALTKVTKA
jgi:TP901-1 family phage major tail protein